MTVLRDVQQDAISFILQSCKRFVGIEAPTGVGKSLIAGYVAQNYPNETIIATPYLALQNQYKISFDTHFSIATHILQGRRAHNCEYSGDQCRDHCKVNMCGHDLEIFNYTLQKGVKKNDCPYWQSIRMASGANFVVANFASLYYQYRHYHRWAKTLIIDEAHKILDFFADFCRISVNLKLLEDLLSAVPSSMELLQIKAFYESQSIESFLSNRQLSVDFLRRLHTELSSLYSKYDFEPSGIVVTTLGRLSRVLEVSNLSSCYFLELTDKGKRKPNGFILGSHNVSQYILRFLYLFDKVIFLSGTLNEDFLFNICKLPKDETDVKRYDSPFPIENRPTFLHNDLGKLLAADYTSLAKDQFVKFINRTEEICKLYPNKRGIIPVISYSLACRIYENVSVSLKNRLILFKTPDERVTAINQLKRTKNGILIGTKLEEGFDFPDDDARFLILFKLPYPEDKTHQKELDPVGFFNKIYTAVVQASGRVCRSVSDWGHVHILDQKIINAKDRYQKYFVNSWVNYRAGAVEAYLEGRK